MNRITPYLWDDEPEWQRLWDRLDPNVQNAAASPRNQTGPTELLAYSCRCNSVLVGFQPFRARCLRCGGEFLLADKKPENGSLP